jgi:hypothetical protein
MKREGREGREGKAKEKQFLSFAASINEGTKRVQLFSFDFPSRPSR